MSSATPCLYCGDPTAPKTIEHVLQRGFGANLTLPDDVCGDCNTKRCSGIDKVLVEFARHYVYWDHPDVTGTRTILQEGHGLWFDESSRTWISVRVDRSVKPLLFTQLVFLENGKISLHLDGNSAPDWEAQIAQLLAELCSPADLSIKTIIVRDPGRVQGAPPVQPAIIRSARQKYLIRAASDEAAAKLKKILETGKLAGSLKREQGPRERSHGGIWIEQQVSVDRGGMERALAKTALNYACKVFGPEYARRPVFDPIRRFVLGAYDEEHRGFVSTLFGQDMNPEFVAFVARFVNTSHHAIFMVPSEHGPLAFIVLYGKAFAAVRLTRAPSPEATSPEAIVTTVFDHVGKTSETLRMGPEMLRMFFSDAAG